MSAQVHPQTSDRTILIPTPGVKRNRPAPHPIAPASSLNQNENFQLTQGLNPLVNASATLLNLAVTLRSSISHSNVASLHQQICEELQCFERETQQEGFSQEATLSARYLLCTFIDEMVLNTPWGASSGWSQRSLLSVFHNETFGGEKSFLLLQKMQENPANHIDTLELFYLCLSLGFEGKYRLDPRGNNQIEELRDGLYQILENHRGSYEADLSSNWTGKVKKKPGLIHYIPLWVIASCVFAVLIVSYSGFRYWLNDITTPTTEKLENMLSRENQKPQKTDTQQLSL